MTGHTPQHGLIELSRNTNQGPVSCLVNPVGASLEGLQVHTLELIERFTPGSPRPFSAGVSLAPWPNRVRDGRWTWEGEELLLEVTEPARQTALHGLVTDREFDVSFRSADSVELTCPISHEPGYPFELEVSVRYDLTDSGVTVTMSATNTGSRPAPVAFGAHPFLCLGELPTRSLSVIAPVDREVLVDDRLLPTGLKSLDSDTPEGVTFPLEGRELDTAFGMRGQGPWRTILRSDNGTSLEMWQDASMPWLQMFITDVFPGLTGPRTAIAVEPMTAPPNAFGSGEDLTVVAPGEQWSVQWGIERVG